MMSVDLKAIELRLNSEPDYQREFLKDPVRLLQKEGLELTDPMIKKLRNFVGNLSGAQTGVAGSSLGAPSGQPYYGLDMAIEKR